MRGLFRKNLKNDFLALGNIRDSCPLNVAEACLAVLQKHKVPVEELIGPEYLMSDAMSGSTILLTTYPDKLASSKTILIGKGVCYDSGGYNIKGSSMKGMFSDKTGAILALMASIATGIPARVLFVNNMIHGHTAYLPGSILTSKSGVKVHIDNTDAEGRIVLADILDSLPSKKKKVISIATLTGACVQFMGERRGALVHTLDKKVAKSLIDTYPKILLYPAPNHPDVDKAIISRIKGADIDNLARDDSDSGSQIGYSFLKHFYPAELLTHVDIAAMDSDSDGNALGWGIEEIKHLLTLV